jgi:hypothetical protein
MKFLRRFRAVGLLLVVLAAVGITPIFAVDITYSTVGSFSNCAGGFSCVNGATSLTGPGGLTIAFTGDTGDLVSAPPPTYASFGTFTVTGPSAGPNDNGTANFQLLVTQAIPTPGGTETLNDTVKGTISKSASTVQVTFSSGTGSSAAVTNAVLGTDPVNGPVAALAFTFLDPTNTNNVTYWVDQTTPIHPSTVGSPKGTSIINGAITSTVPEPTFYTLTGTGFLSLLGMAIRRRRQKV